MILKGQWFRNYRVRALQNPRLRSTRTHRDMLQEFSVPSEPLDAVFFKIRLSILTQEGFEAIDLTKYVG